MNYYFEENVYDDEDYNYLDKEILEEPYDDNFDQYSTNFHEILIDTFENCIKPSLNQVSQALIPIYVYLIVYQIIKARKILTTRLLNILNIIGCLCYLNYHFSPLLLSTFVLHSLIIYGLIKTTKHWFRGNNGVTTTLFSLIYILTCELFLVKQEQWHKIRGAQMILMMKLISFSFDIDNFKIETYDMISYFDYAFSINTSIFGPWISYNDYLNHFKNRKVDYLKLFKTTVYSLISFCLSNCLINLFYYFFENSNNLLDAFTNASSFRFSNYFILYTSSSLCIINNIYHRTNVGHDIVNPLKVELPRSLISVVTNWNLPMHFWLKTYVFKQVKIYGNFKALLFTYIVSSLLHGLNLKIGAVLLSLGVYTYVEYVFRKRLSKRLNACVDSKLCNDKCGHYYKNDSPLTIFVNFLFLIVNLFHLAYLGQMFDNNNENSIDSLGYTLSKWSQLYYSSHLMILLFYIVSKFI